MAKSCGEDDMMINIIRPPEEAKRHSKEIVGEPDYQSLPSLTESYARPAKPLGAFGLVGS